MTHIEYLSPSSINRFLTDYTGWYKHYILGEQDEDNIYKNVGTACHQFLENFFLLPPQDYPEMLSISEFATMKFKESYDLAVTKNFDLQDWFSKETVVTEKEVKEWLTERVKTWVKETSKLESKYGSRNAYKFNRPSFIEFPVKDEVMKVQGYIDNVTALYNTKDKFHELSQVSNVMIVDYKTSGKTLDTLHTDYFIQLMIYALIMHRMGFNPKWISIDYLKYNQRYFFYVDQSIFSSIEKFIYQVRQEIDSVCEMYDKGEDVCKYKVKTKIGDFL